MTGGSRARCRHCDADPEMGRGAGDVDGWAMDCRIGTMAYALNAAAIEPAGMTSATMFPSTTFYGAWGASTATECPMILGMRVDSVFASSCGLGSSPTAAAARKRSTAALSRLFDRAAP